MRVGFLRPRVSVRWWAAVVVLSLAFGVVATSVGADSAAGAAAGVFIATGLTTVGVLAWRVLQRTVWDPRRRMLEAHAAQRQAEWEQHQRESEQHRVQREWEEQERVHALAELRARRVAEEALRQEAAARAAVEHAEWWSEDPSDPEDMPFRFNPPPGWPAPKRAWLPDRQWEPARQLSAPPPAWELWQRTAPRARDVADDDPYGPRPTWTAFLSSFDEQGLRAAAGTVEGRAALARQADGLAAELDRRREAHTHQAADPSWASGRRSRWHPLEQNCVRALELASTAVDALPGALEAAARGDVEGLVSAWRGALRSVDELADADDERTAEDRVELSASLVAELGEADRAERAWEQAELLVAASLRDFGYTDAKVTAAGADSGVDVESPAVAAQVKYTAKPVGRPVVQQLSGAARGRLTAFFSRAGYSAHAVDEADRVGMALFRIALPATVVPVNRHAERMAAVPRT